MQSAIVFIFGSIGGLIGASTSIRHKTRHAMAKRSGKKYYKAGYRKKTADAAKPAVPTGNSHRREAVAVHPFNVSVCIEQPRHDLCVAMPAGEDHERWPLVIRAIRRDPVGEPRIGSDHVGVRSEQTIDDHHKDPDILVAQPAGGDQRRFAAVIGLVRVGVRGD